VLTICDLYFKIVKSKIKKFSPAIYLFSDWFSGGPSLKTLIPPSACEKVSIILNYDTFVESKRNKYILFIVQRNYCRDVRIDGIRLEQEVFIMDEKKFNDLNYL
jgi:hypothetical protein